MRYRVSLVSKKCWRLRFLCCLLSGLALLMVWVPGASAKLLPFEVQIIGGERTVRVAPNDFYRAINVPGAGRYLGVFDYLESARPGDPHQTPLHISLFLLSSTDDGRVLDEENSNVRRETFVSFSLYESADGAFGKIEPGGDKQFVPGKWIRFSPAFVALVGESYANLPAVEPISAPPHEYRPAPGDPSRNSILARAAARTYEMALVSILVIAILLVRWSRRVVIRESRKHQQSDIGAA